MDAQHFFAQLLQNLKVAKEIAGTNMKNAQEKPKQHHDKKAKLPDFKVGDWVLLKSMKVPKNQSCTQSMRDFLHNGAGSQLYIQAYEFC